MNHSVWAQLRELRDLQERMNRFFDDARGRDDSGEDGDWAQQSEWNPPADIFENGNDLILRMDLPAIDQEAISLKVDGNRLVISGERRLDPEIKKEHYFRIERPVGRFCRSFALPETVDRERIVASCEEGVLEVKLPRRAEKEPRVISIEVK